MTPAGATGKLLQSITRKSVLQAAAIEGIETNESRLSPDLLYEIDELFISGTPAKVVPINKIDDYALKTVPGPISRRISELFDNILAGRDERFKDWLFPVE